MQDFSFNEETMYVDADGYPRFKRTDLLVHRWVKSKQKNRRLSPEEVVHHNDGDKMNFHPSNLRLFKNQEDHEAHHRWKDGHLGGWHGDGKNTGYASSASYSGDSGGDYGTDDSTGSGKLSAVLLLGIPLLTIGIITFFIFYGSNAIKETTISATCCVCLPSIIILIIFARQMIEDRRMPSSGSVFLLLLSAGFSLIVCAIYINVILPILVVILFFAVIIGLAILLYNRLKRVRISLPPKLV